MDFIVCCGAFLTMKTWIARSIVFLAVIGFAGPLLYELYIQPLQKADSVDTPMEYVLAVLIMTALYAVAGFIVHLLIKGIGWAIDNAD